MGWGRQVQTAGLWRRQTPAQHPPLSLSTTPHPTLPHPLTLADLRLVAVDEDVEVVAQLADIQRVPSQ